MILKGLAIAVTLLLQQPLFVAGGGAAGPSSTPPTFVSATEQNQGSGSSNTVTWTCGSGNMLILAGSTLASSATFTLTTTSGNTITSLISEQTAGTVTSRMWIVSSCNGSAGNYVLTPSSGTFGNLIVSEYTKGSLAGVLDATNTCTGSTGGVSPSCSVTSAAAGELMLVHIVSNNGVSGYPGASGFQLREGSSQTDAFYDLIPTVSGSNTFPGVYAALNASAVTIGVAIK
jgi:hypothetical protein